jgi:Zn-dependent protease
MFGPSVRLFRILGIDIRIDLGWALIATFIAWSLAQGVFPQLYEGFSATAYWQMAIAAVVGLAASIILHELAHSVVAKAFGLPLKSITLFVFGGVASLEEEPKTPLAEFLMAIAGPLMSVGLALAFGWSARQAAEAAPTATGALEYLALINWVLAIFNMVPAFPLDGGRVFRSIVWAIKRDYFAATRWAARVGVLLGTTVMILGAFAAFTGRFAEGLWWVVIGLFIRSAAMGAVYQARMQRLFEGAPVQRFMTSDPVAAPPDISLRDFVDDYVYRFRHDLFPVVRQGKLVGAIGMKETSAVPRNAWEKTNVGDAMARVSDANTIEVSADSMQALAKMRDGKASRLLVLDDGRLVGIVALKDFLDLLSLKLALGER